MLQEAKSNGQGSDSHAAAAKPATQSSAQHAGHANHQHIPIEQMLQKDAYLVFRALCKLSHRTSENSAGPDITVLKGKVRTPQGNVSISGFISMTDVSTISIHVTQSTAYVLFPLPS